MTVVKHGGLPRKQEKLTHPQRRQKKTRRCNICDQAFRVHSKFDRFCDCCKKESEVYQFADWLSYVA